MLERMKALHPIPRTDYLVSIISHRYLPPKPCVSSDFVRAAPSAIDLDFATGPDRAGVRWTTVLVNSEHRVLPDFLGLKLLTIMVQKLAVGDLFSNASHLISAANLISFDKGGAKIGPIAIGVYMRRLITKSLMLASIIEAKVHMTLLQMGYSVN